MWTDFILPLLLFSAKLVVVLFFVGLFFAFIFMLAGQARVEKKSTRLKVNDWKQNLEKWHLGYLAQLGNNAKMKAFLKNKKAQEKAQAKAQKNKSTNAELPVLFVLDFVGDIQASATERLKKEVSFLLSIAKPQDEVLLRIKSLGGTVIGYGQAASELHRLKKSAVFVTSAIDQVAASGGYMLACVANKVIASPLALVGSIGVVAEIPNVHRLLKKNDVDYRVYQAGKYKRTVSILGESTPAGERKFQEDLQVTHQLFQKLVKEHRPNVDLEQIATGEVWYGQLAVEKGLVDELGTSEEYIFQKKETHAIQEIQLVEQAGLLKKMSAGSVELIDTFYHEWKNKLSSGILAKK